MKERYFQHFREILTEFKPSIICEIGTHNAKTALQIIHHLIKLNVKHKYVGYDAFNLANNSSDIQEINGKGPGDYNLVLSKFRKVQNSLFSFELHRGWTQDTLTEGVYDFVFIDGGHSYETVKYDHSKLKESKIVVFDDYEIPDVQKYFDEYVWENRIEQVAWNLTDIKKQNKTVFSFMPRDKGNKEFKLGTPGLHLQPVIFNMENK